MVMRQHELYKIINEHLDKIVAEFKCVSTSFCFKHSFIAFKYENATEIITTCLFHLYYNYGLYVYLALLLN